MRLTRKLAIPALALAVLAGGLTLGAALPTEGVGPPTPTTQTCMEDQPCWDCESMGNHICGTLTEAQAADAWAVFDHAGGAEQLLVNPHAKVTLTGYTTTDPYAKGADMLTVHQLALHHAGTWFIFTAEAI